MSCSARRCYGICCPASEFRRTGHSPRPCSPARRSARTVLPSVQLALHWHGAGEHERALRAAWAAAAEAGAAFAYAEQLQMLELVLDLWERVPGRGRAQSARTGRG